MITYPRTALLDAILLLALPAAAFADGPAKPRSAAKKPSRPPRQLGPALPRSKRRACRRGADCVLLPRICPGCPPCAPRWRTPGNKRELERVKRVKAKTRCRPHKCRFCPGSGSWLGTGAICAKRQCRAVHRPAAQCSRDADCALLPGRFPTECGCVPCRKQAVARARLEQLKRQWSRAAPCARRCSPCPLNPKTKAVCRRSRCVAAP